MCSMPPPLSPLQLWPDLAAFYGDDERRSGSKEVDFGTRWLTTTAEPPWRVSWVVATGELYAVRSEGGGPVELLGRFPTRRQVEEALRNWPHMYGTIGSLAWVRRRCRAA